MTTEYKYDGSGNRLSQKVGTVTTQFVNDISSDLTKVLVSKNTSTSASTYFVQGPNVISEGGAADTSRQYYLYDGMGNVRFLTDNSGNKLQYLSFDPYGNQLTGNAGVFNYKGEQVDQGGMYFMRARFYDPTTGRFTSKDPVAGHLIDPQTQNGYNYADVDPINLSDPSGKCSGPIAAVLCKCATDVATKLWPAANEAPLVINGLTYTKEALLRMEPVGFGGRGIPPSVVENAVEWGTKTLGNVAGRLVNEYENVQVVTNEALDTVITVIKTGH